MDKTWLKQYPLGVPAEINSQKYNSLSALLLECFEKFADKPAFTHMGSLYTYREVGKTSHAFAAYLQQQGLQPGDRIALMMPNLMQYPIALFGALIAGLTVVNVNPLYTARELEHQLSDSGAKAIVACETAHPTLDEVLKKQPLDLIITTGIADLLPFPKNYLINFALRHLKKLVKQPKLANAISFRHALALGFNRPVNYPSITHDDLAFLQYTGGTTGVAKGAMLSHGNILANLEQIESWLNEDKVDDHLIVTALPLYHIFALTVNCLTFFKMGAHNVLITNPRDLDAFIKVLKKHPLTAFTGVNTLFQALLNHPALEEIDFSCLKLTIAGGMAAQKSVADAWKSVTGVPLLQGYGLTEASPVVSMTPLDAKHFTGSIGLPLPSTKVCIFNEEGEYAELGNTGELGIKGPQVMKGYWQRDEETKHTFTSDGWLLTGDIAKINENGELFIVDRKKDMILVSGFNVFPNEIEEVAAKHEDISEVACVGVPHGKSGEAVKLFIVKKNEQLTKEAVLQFCRKNLTGYKVPKYIEFIDTLPKTNVGKILRRELRDNKAA